MTPYYVDPDVTLYQGDVLDTLRAMPDASVDCVVTSPPYWGLRDYGTGTWEGGDPECDHRGPSKASEASGLKNDGRPPERVGQNDYERGATVPFRDACGKCCARRIDQQLGLEPTPDEYVARMVDVFREVRRVLADHGTCWLNLGDSYAGGGRGGHSDGIEGPPPQGAGNGYPSSFKGMKPKDLVGIPWRVAFALQQPYYAGRIKDKGDRRWLAAILDAEGTICGMRHERPDGNIRTGCMVFITNTSEPLLDECDRIWKGARYSEKTTSEVARPCWRWELQAAEERSALVRELYPYLIEKKQQALVAWNLLEVVQAAKKLGRGGETKATKDRRDYLVRLLSDLNGRRPVDLPSWLQVPPSLFEPGWYVRSDVIWSKSNPMPESVTDRPTKSHEYVFLLSKRPRYFFDQEAVREPATYYGPNGSPQTMDGENNARRGEMKGRAGRPARRTPLIPEQTKAGVGTQGIGSETFGHWAPNGRNIRSVWDIATQPFPEAHFATFPEELVRRCLLAGCPEWVCRVCGKARERIVDVKPMEIDRSSRTHSMGQTRSSGIMTSPREASTIGFTDCGHNDYRPGVVLDPFMGSGTVAVVARKHNRHAVGIDLNPEYLAMAARRLSQQSLLTELA